LEGEMTECLGAAPGERTEGRTGERAGDYSRSLITRIGKLELRVPRDRKGEFSSALFDRYTRSEKALVAALAERVVQGVSTRKVKAITDHGGVVRSQRLGQHDEQHQQEAGRGPGAVCQLAPGRGLSLPDPWTTCRARRTMIACRSCYDRRDIQEAQRELAAWISQWQGKYPKLLDWVETNIGATLTFYRLAGAHHKHMKSTNMLERLNEEIKRRPRVVRIFPNADACLRLIRALCVEAHEAWLEDSRDLNMKLLSEKKKEVLRLAA
jgi:transposase-like protein